MLRSIKKEAFLKITAQRPALVRKLQKPNDDYIADIIVNNPATLSFMDKSWLTLPVLLILIPKHLENNNHSVAYLSNYPLEVRAQATEEKTFEGLMAERNLMSVIRFFPNAPYKFFLKWVSEDNYSTDYNDIPEQHRTDDLIGTLLATCSNYASIPDEAYTDGIVDKALSLKPESLVSDRNKVPVKFLTYDRLKTAFSKNSEIRRKDIPEEVWDDPLAELAMNTPANFKHLPLKFRTKDRCLKAVRDEPLLFKHVPLKDQDILLAALTFGSLNLLEEYIPVKMLTKPFLLELAKADAANSDYPHGIENYLLKKKISPEEWLEILAICPRELRHIPKNEQSDAMIKVFFEHASVDDIDGLKNYLNLARITKDYAAYLIGCKEKIFQDLAARKMAPKPHASRKSHASKSHEAEKPVVITAKVVGVELTDGEYRELSSTFII